MTEAEGRGGRSGSKLHLGATSATDQLMSLSVQLGSVGVGGFSPLSWSALWEAHFQPQNGKTTEVPTSSRRGLGNSSTGHVALACCFLNSRAGTAAVLHGFVEKMGGSEVLQKAMAVRPGLANLQLSFNHVIQYQIIQSLPSYIAPLRL